MADLFHQEDDLEGGEEFANPGGEQEETDSDADLPPPCCPLCSVDEVLPETAATVVSDNAFMRRIMAQELVHYGMLPDSVIYSNIARTYNKHIRKPLLRSGVACERWTLPMVRKHFEEHVNLLPRRILGKQIRLCTRLLGHLEKEVNSHFGAALGALAGADAMGDAPPVQPEFVDGKTVKKICDVQAKLVPLIEKYRQFQKEDQMAQSVATLWRSVELGATSTEEASKLLASAAALATAAGSGDLPTASDLFG